MRFQVNRRSAWLLTALLLGASCMVGRAATPVPTPPSGLSSPALGSDPEEVLQRALHLERQRNWTAAIELYGQALEQWPSRSEFGRRRRLCESHCKLVRRYQDQSFRKVLLRLPRQKAMDLYDELLDRIETHYVDPVSLEPLVRRGLDNMEVALRDPAFLGTNAPRATPERVNRLRAALSDGVRGSSSPTATRRRPRSSPPASRRPGRWSRPHRGDPGVRLRGLRCARRLHELPDPRQARRPLRHDRRQFRRPGHRAEARREGLRLVGVIRGGPAWEAGVKVGDRIIRVGENRSSA